MKLYVLRTCPYCQHVLHYIQENGINIDIVEVPRDHGARTDLQQVSGQTYVPTLVDGDTLIADDDDRIIAYPKDAARPD